MPLLDVSDVLTDPDLLDWLFVTRNVQTMVDGYAVNTPSSWKFYGVVTSAGGISLQRRAEGQRMEQRILVITRTRLVDGRIKADGTANSADIVTWDDTTYTVVNVDPYKRYGRGFVQATCDLIPITG